MKNKGLGHLKTRWFTTKNLFSCRFLEPMVYVPAPRIRHGKSYELTGSTAISNLELLSAWPHATVDSLSQFWKTESGDFLCIGEFWSSKTNTKTCTQCMVDLPTFGWFFMINVGTYARHGSSGNRLDSKKFLSSSTLGRFRVYSSKN